MNETEKIVDVLEKVVSGGKVFERTGSWVIDNLASSNLVGVIYGKRAASYAFEIRKSREAVTFYNYHRRAVKGKGTESLKLLEYFLGLLAKRIGKPIILEFPKLGQEETAKWLRKNGYREVSGKAGEVFVKEVK